jgi:hypothetical protein
MLRRGRACMAGNVVAPQPGNWSEFPAPDAEDATAAAPIATDVRLRAKRGDRLRGSAQRRTAALCVRAPAAGGSDLGDTKKRWKVDHLAALAGPRPLAPGRREESVPLVHVLTDVQTETEFARILRMTGGGRSQVLQSVSDNCI